MAKLGKQEDPELKAKSVAMRLLSRREHSRFELATKLRQRKLEAAIIDPVLDEFEAEGWLCDDRFAEVYARQRIELSYGPLRIRSELQQRGIPFAPECLRAVTEAQWVERATALRGKRFGCSDIRDDWNEKARQARFLAQRGFSTAQVEQALEVVGEQD